MSLRQEESLGSVDQQRENGIVKKHNTRKQTWRHEKEHGVRRFKCNQYNKAFTLLQNLKSHEIAHTILNPYKCGYCEKTFLYSSHLHTHERTHSGVHVKPYKCSHCEKAFARLQCLQNHEKNTHSGVKPYKCSHCDKEFTCSSYLKKHVRDILA